MKKSILIPIIALVLAAAVLLGVSAGFSARREANLQAELNAKLNTLLPGDLDLNADEFAAWINDLSSGAAEGAAFTREEYAGEDANIRAVYKGENGYVIATGTYGYAGDIAMLIGVNNEGRVTGLQVREHQPAPLHPAQERGQGRGGRGGVVHGARGHRMDIIGPGIIATGAGLRTA